ncbi:RNA polymerase sigma factor [Streptomyces sp. NPDC006463]|uniref:RNA polymerase sigma factor n=1 Tax=Streptomyces sp. NPDC006463 TaxID=3364746 RepID=UPI00369653E1
MSRVHNAEEFGPADSEAGVPGDIRDPDAMSDEIRAARQGDEAAFRALFRAVQPGLLRYLTVLVGEDAEDVASGTWLQTARDLGSFSGDFDGFRGWVATTGRNRALDLMRRRGRRPLAGLPVGHLLDRPGAEDTGGAAPAVSGTAEALALISRLPRDQAEAVLLRVVMDLDAEGAARVLGKRPGAVRTAAHRGLRKLAELIEQQEANPPGSGGGADGAGGAAGAEGAGGAAGAVRPKPRWKSFTAGVTPTAPSTLKSTR